MSPRSHPVKVPPPSGLLFWLRLALTFVFSLNSTWAQSIFTVGTTWKPSQNPEWCWAQVFISCGLVLSPKLNCKPLRSGTMLYIPVSPALRLWRVQCWLHNMYRINTWLMDLLWLSHPSGKMDVCPRRRIQVLWADITHGARSPSVHSFTLSHPHLT